MEDIKEANIDGKKIPFVFISADNIKMSRDFRQPLSKQAYKLLMEIKEHNGGFEYVFHSTSKKKLATDLESYYLSLPNAGINHL